MKAVTYREIQIRQIGNFYQADADYGIRLANGLGIGINDVIGCCTAKEETWFSEQRTHISVRRPQSSLARIWLRTNQDCPHAQLTLGYRESS